MSRELALRFTAYVPGVSTCIVGTGRLDNLRRNLKVLKQGPLPDDFVDAIREAIRRNDHGWDGMV